MAYDKTNSFALFRNSRKTEDKHPDYTGSFTDDQGREFFCDAWIREKDGKKYMSGKMKLKNKQGGTQTQKPKDDFIP